MQQEAVRKLGMTAQRTMRVAQQLYEGIDIGGSEGDRRSDYLHAYRFSSIGKGSSE